MEYVDGMDLKPYVTFLLGLMQAANEIVWCHKIVVIIFQKIKIL